MINRSTTISARRASNGNNNNSSSSSSGGNLIVHSDNESSKLKAKNSSSRRSLVLPMVTAALVLLVILHFGLLLPASSVSKRKKGLLRVQSHKDSSIFQKTNSKYRLTPRSQFPKGWKHLSYDDMRHHLNCRSRTKDMNKPLPSVDDWNFMRQTYAQLLVNHNNGETTTTTTEELPWENDLVPPTLGYSLTPGVPVPPPYHAKLSPGKGRGLFASRDIDKGELVHDGTVSDIIFPDAMTYRTFVFSLPTNFNCDALEWVWMQQLEQDGGYHLLMGINISSLMNSGGRDWNDAESKTVNCVPENEYSGKFYATRGIKEGEEILTDYDVYYTKWSLVGLG